MYVKFRLRASVAAVERINHRPTGRRGEDTTGKIISRARERGGATAGAEGTHAPGVDAGTRGAVDSTEAPWGGDARCIFWTDKDLINFSRPLSRSPSLPRPPPTRYLAPPPPPRRLELRVLPRPSACVQCASFPVSPRVYLCRTPAPINHSARAVKLSSCRVPLSSSRATAGLKWDL